jgi:hypothetical protein
MELKQNGCYLARTLSFAGVNFEHMHVSIDGEFRELYDAAAQLWADTNKVREAASWARLASSSHTIAWSLSHTVAWSAVPALLALLHVRLIGHIGAVTSVQSHRCSHIGAVTSVQSHRCSCLHAPDDSLPALPCMCRTLPVCAGHACTVVPATSMHACMHAS